MSKWLIPFKILVYNTLYEPVKKCYYRRWTQYPRTGKIALCCIAKLENDYIRHFVEYYKKLNFDKIYLYDNNDIDGERFDIVIGDYIRSGYVEIIDYRGKKVAQLSAYQDCYEKYNKEYSWMAFFDIDEFLTFKDGTTDAHLFLSKWKFLPYQMIHLNWMVYGDDGMLDTDGRNVIERLQNPIYPLDFHAEYDDIPENNHIKSIIRGGLPFIRWKETPHTPVSGIYHCCNPEGEKVEENSPFQDFNFGNCYIRHYSTKTIGEWVRNKMQRGIPDRSEDKWKSALNLDRFFRYNVKTKKKVQYAEELMKNLIE